MFFSISNGLYFLFFVKTWTPVFIFYFLLRNLSLKWSLYFNKENDYSEEDTSDNEHFCSTILQQFLFQPEQKKTCGNEIHEKETKLIHASAANFYILVQIQTLPKWNERNRLPLLSSCPEVDTVLIASAKILERKGSISPSSFYGWLSDF